MGLDGLLLVTVPVEGFLPLWANERESDAWTPGPSTYPSASLVAPRCEVRDCQPQMPKGKGRELRGEEAAGCVGLGRRQVEAQVKFGAGHGI